MAKSSPPTFTLLILCSQVFYTHTSASNITLSTPQTPITAQIGEELHITCLATKCGTKDPGFTWSSLMDKTLSGKVNTTGKMSNLTMKVNYETDGSYRCTVSCDNPPGEKRFKITVYSFPSDPILHVSSLVVGQESDITCTFLNIYPIEYLSVAILLDKNVINAANVSDHDLVDMGNFTLTHKLILTEEMDKKEIKCAAILDYTEPMQRQTIQNITLTYPPVKPHIDVRPSTSVRAGEQIFLSCSSDSKSQAGIRWVKQVEDKELEMPSEDQKTLSIPNAQPEDSGVYICHTENSIGKASSQVEINIQGIPEKPTLSIQPGTTVEAGQTVTIECLESNNARVTLWKMKGEDVLFQYAERKITISGADPINAAVYKCTAENQYGVSETLQSLTVEYSPKETSLLPSSTEVNEGDTVRLTCVSNGVPTPNISIHKLSTSGESVLLSEGPEITLSNVTSGIYQCQAKNKLGTDQDMLDLMVRVSPKNTFIMVTPSHTVKEGESVHIQCTSEAVPAPTLVLMRQTERGIEEIKTEQGHYSISHATIDDMGTYICESSNVVGQQSAEAKLTVQVPPKNTFISITPSHMVKEGDSVHIQCTSEAVPAPTLVLMMETEQGMRELKTEQGQYSISSATIHNAGVYRCASTNMAGLQTAEATLTVQVPPQNTQISIYPSSLVREGDNIQIKCISEASPAPRLALKVKMEHEVVDLVFESGEYNISNVGVRHIGTYICESTNAAGSEIAESTLNVEVAPINTSINIIPSSVVIEGDSVQIWCSSEGSPQPKLVLKMRREDELITLESIDGFYNITHVGLENAGMYICESNNVVGQGVALTTLTVYIPPRNTTVVVTPSQNIKEGDTVTITCETHSIPSPTIILQKVCAENNTVLQSRNGTFTLHNVTRHDTGTYILNITNSAGNETEAFSLYVEGRPEHSPRFNPTSVVIFGSVAFVSAGVIASILYHLKKTKLQGSYSLVKALRSKV